jgi:putative ABC transport system permease protein
MLDSWMELWDVLSRNLVRTVLTASGVFWGMLMLVLMLGFGNGLETGVQSTIGGTATSAVYMWGRRATMSYRGLQPRPIRPTNADIEALRDVEGVGILTPRNQLGGWRSGQNVVRGGEVGNYTVSGDTEDWRALRPMRITQGRWLNARDLREERKVAVIGQPVVDDLFEPGEEVLGAVVTVRGVAFQVVGVFRSLAGGERAEREETAVYLPFTTFQEAFADYRNLVGWWAAAPEEGTSAVELEERLRTRIMEILRVHPEDRGAIGSYNSQEDYEKIANLFAGIRLIVWIVGTATLLSGVIGVSNILLVTVRERTSEIGLRRALGATPLSVVLMILREALVLTSVSGYLGLVAGVALLEVARALIGEGSDTMGPPSIDLGVALAAVGVLVVGGLLAGLLPARHAASIHPAHALRS